MIKVKILKKNESIIGFEVRDHANFDKHGADIVCAAVSMLTFNTIDTFTDLLDMESNISYDISEALIKFKLRDKLEGNQEHDSQLILNKFELGMVSIQNQYGDYIRINYMEV